MNWYDVPMEDRARKGIELLDRVEPDWRTKINLDILDMQSERWCILGQLYGTYGTGYKLLGIDGVEYGFDGIVTMSRSDLGLSRRTQYNKLTSLWRELCSAS